MSNNWSGTAVITHSGNTLSERVLHRERKPQQIDRPTSDTLDSRHSSFSREMPIIILVLVREASMGYGYFSESTPDWRKVLHFVDDF